MKLSKERLEEIRDFDTCVKLEESAEMARHLLSGLEQEPVAEISQAQEYDLEGNLRHQRDIDYYQDDIDKLPVGTKLYAAPQLTQPAVYELTAETLPDEIKQMPAATAFVWMDGWNKACRAAMLQGAEPVSQPCKLRDGWVAVPKRLTAENGAKAALIGEFNLEYSLTCHECFGEGCEDCSGEGSWTNTVPIDWATIKDIWAKAIDHFAAAPQKEVK